jgi:peptide/nickel transport system substrate-binding protein
VLRRLQIWLTIPLALLTVLSACSPGSGPTGTAAPSAAATHIPGGTVTIRLQGDWTTLDTQGASETNGNQIGFAIYDRLVSRGPDGKIVPYLAKSWTATSTSATFTLRDDATCSDGTKVTPTVVANSFKRLFDPKTGAFLLPRVLGPGPFSVSSDEAAGTVTITLGTPNSDLISGFASQAGMILCPAALADPTKLPQSGFGSGPYTLESAVRGDSAVLKLRKEWKWGPNGTTASTSGFPETIVFKVVANLTTAANQLLTGGLDVAQILGPDVPRLQADKSLLQRDSHGFQGYPLLFNQKPGRITTSEPIREALMTIVDAKDWNTAAFDGRGTPSTGSIVAADVPCYHAGTSQFYPTGGLEKALAVLKADGWSLVNGKQTKDGKVLTITIISSQSTMPRPATEYVQAQFTKLGVNAVVNDTDQPTFLSNLRGGNFDVVVVPATNSGPQISGAVTTFSGEPYPKGVNYGNIVDPELEREIKTALAAPAGDCKAWNTIQELLLKKHYVLPLSAPTWTWFGRDIDFFATANFIEVWSLRRVK